jgi:hypothetical protein
VIEGALAGATHDQQVAPADLVAPGTPFPFRTNQEPAAVSEREVRDQCDVLAPPLPISVPGDAVSAVSIEVHPAGDQPLAVTFFERPDHLDQDRPAGELGHLDPAREARLADHPVIDAKVVFLPVHGFEQLVEEAVRSSDPSREEVDPGPVSKLVAGDAREARIDGGLEIAVQQTQLQGGGALHLLLHGRIDAPETARQACSCPGLEVVRTYSD